MHFRPFHGCSNAFHPLVIVLVYSKTSLWSPTEFHYIYQCFLNFLFLLTFSVIVIVIPANFSKRKLSFVNEQNSKGVIDVSWCGKG